MSFDVARNVGERPSHSGEGILRGSLYIFLGQAAPLLVGLAVVPHLVAHLSLEKFGLLTLMWAGMGYFILFDLGLGRALIKLTSQALATGREGEIPLMVWTSLFTLTGTGVVIAGILYFTVEPLIFNFVQMSPGLREEAVLAFQILILGIPIVSMAGSLRGLLEAQRRFRVVAVTHGIHALSIFLGPALVVLIAPNLAWIAAVLVISRIAILCIYLILNLKALPGLRSWPKWRWDVLKQLFVLGGWMTVSNMINPFLIYFDRFLLGVLVTMSLVAFYTTPFEIMARLLIVPTTLYKVLFPTLSFSMEKDPRGTDQLFLRSVKFLSVCLIAVSFLVSLFGREALYFWLGAEFAEKSRLVVQIAALGVIASGLGGLAFTYIQSYGRPDLTAKFQSLQVPFYILLVWTLTSRYGYYGTAVSWTLRVFVDLCLMFGIMAFMSSNHRATLKVAIKTMILSLLVIGPLWLEGRFQVSPTLFGVKVIYGILAMAGIFISTWYSMLTLEDREWVRKRFLRRIASR